MEQPDTLLFKLNRDLVIFAQEERAVYLSGVDRAENDSEHSYAVVMMSWHLFEELKPPLSLEKILKYAIAHDYPEVLAGDVNAFATEKDRKQKVIDEAKAIDDLEKDYEGKFDALITAMRGYEDKTEEESLFVWTVDKLQALITCQQDDWRPYIEQGHNYDSFVRKYSGDLERCSPYLKDLFTEIVEFGKSDFPKDKIK